MTSSSNGGDRLDRIEALIEQIGQKVDSNARSIQALSEDRRESERDRARFYQEMANLSASMANLSNAQADFYRRMEDFSRRQGDIVEILKLLRQQGEQ